MNSTSDLSESKRSKRTLLPLTPTVVNRMRIRRIAPWIAGIVTVLLLVGTFMIGRLVRDSMREVTHKSIRSIMSANLSSLELWATQRRSDVDGVIRNDGINQTAVELLEKFTDVKKLDIKEMQRQSAELVSKMPSDLSQRSYLGWALLDSNSRVIASDFDCLVAQSLPIPKDVQTKLDRLQTCICRPFESPVALTVSQEENLHPLSVAGAPLMIAGTPIKQGNRAVGCLALLIDPLDRFSKIMHVARMGATGETYVFDRDGLLLTRSRYEHLLRTSGLLDEDTSVSSVLNVFIRKPGVDISKQRVNAATISSAPPTLMADQATRGGNGSSMSGYKNYRGAHVIGTWIWLSKYGFGIATEMNYSEAFSPMQILTNSFLGLIGLIAVASVGLFTFASALRWFGEHSPQTDRLRRLGQYKLGKVIGNGAMGAVYQGKHEFLRRVVAIKVLEENDVTTQSLSRFEREVRMTAQLRHPNTIAVYDYGRSAEGAFFYVMEYVDGITLQELVDTYGPLKPQRVIYLLDQICGSLAEAHGQSMVHRDIKPANILLTCQAGLYDMVKVLDFGLVKDFDANALQLTQVASITGTPLYMSPEVVRDASSADCRSDIYSLGAVAYFLLTGISPFEGGSPADVCAKQLHETPCRPSDRIDSELADDIQNIVMACLEKSPANRPQTMNELSQLILQCQQAHDWTVANACHWWQETYVNGQDQGPRDDESEITDNANDTSGTESNFSNAVPPDGQASNDEHSEKTAW